jgi:hypothetical protein
LAVASRICTVEKNVTYPLLNTFGQSGRRESDCAVINVVSCGACGADIKDGGGSCLRLRVSLKGAAAAIIPRIPSMPTLRMETTREGRGAEDTGAEHKGSLLGKTRAENDEGMEGAESETASVRR